MDAIVAFFLSFFSPDPSDQFEAVEVSEVVLPEGLRPQELSIENFGVAPELAGLENWINSEGFESIGELRGEVVMIDFWTYSCINCIRTLPHVQALHEKYADKGLVVLGVHAPEFAYERKIGNVRNAVDKYGLTYPVVQDNDFSTWRNYKNRYWPAHYIVGKEGNIRYKHFGEGAYEEIDQVVKYLIDEGV